MKPSPTILALDLGTKCGWAVGARQHMLSGALDTTPKRFESSGVRFVKFLNLLRELHAATPVDHVVVEEVARHAGNVAAHTYGGFLAHMQTWAIGEGIEYSGQPVGTIKKWATGRGNAGKPEMIAAARDAGFDPTNDDEADAIALWHLQHGLKMKRSVAA